jgi:hypothetical protein
MRCAFESRAGIIITQPKATSNHLVSLYSLISHIPSIKPSVQANKNSQKPECTQTPPMMQMIAVVFYRDLLTGPLNMLDNSMLKTELSF